MSFNISDFKNDEKSLTFIIDVLSSNYDRTIKATKEVVPDAIKFQSYTTDTITEKTFGCVDYKQKHRVKKVNSEQFTRFLFVVEDLKVVETEENVRSIRQGNRIKPKYIELVLGKRVTHMGTAVSKNLISKW